MSVSRYFAGDKWKVHPDWTYCEYLFDSIKNFETPEERIQHFLNLASGPGWKWRSIRPKISNHQKHPSKPDKDSYYYCKNFKNIKLLKPLIYFFIHLSSIFLRRTTKKKIAKFGKNCNIKIIIAQQSLSFDENNDFCFFKPGDKRLLQSLVMDAWVTRGFDKRIELSSMHKERWVIEKLTFHTTKSKIIYWGKLQSHEFNEHQVNV